jgi:uncharacterized protein YqiB (DUF1249 family)
VAGPEQTALAGALEKIRMNVLSRSTRYTVDLQHLQTVCALNYGRFRRLLPELASPPARLSGSSQRSSQQTSQKLSQDYYRFHWDQADQAPALLEIDVLERSPYTDTLILRQTTTRLPWCPQLDMEVRVYHDAELAEVLRFQAARRIPARNRYPNLAMHARDEKTQVNEFLAECLDHCLREGYADWVLPVGHLRAVGATL